MASAAPRSAFMMAALAARTMRNVSGIPRCPSSSIVRRAQSQSPVSIAAVHAMSASGTAMSPRPIAVASSSPRRAVSMAARGSSPSSAHASLFRARSSVFSSPASCAWPMASRRSVSPASLSPSENFAVPRVTRRSVAMAVSSSRCAADSARSAHSIASRSSPTTMRARASSAASATPVASPSQLRMARIAASSSTRAGSFR